MQVKGTGSWCMLVEYVRTITMQVFMILAIIGTEKDTLVFHLSRNLAKSMEREM